LTQRIKFIQIQHVRQHNHFICCQPLGHKVFFYSLGIGHHAHRSLIGPAQHDVLPPRIDLPQVTSTGNQFYPRPPGGVLAKNRGIGIPGVKNVHFILPKPEGQSPYFAQCGRTE